MSLIADKIQVSQSKIKDCIDALNYELISHHDYAPFANNELTKEKLQKLADFSKTIESPFTLGKFNSEQHYLKTLALVLASTHETRNRILFFLNEILPMIPVNGSLLDIGPGDGSLTKSLAQHFKHITLVDINHHGLERLEKLLRSSINLEQITGSILNIELKSDRYNLAVLSHMLYYIEPQLWLGVIKSVFKSLKGNGVLVIILGGDELGKSKLIKYFGGEVLGIDQLAMQCRNTFGVANVGLFASDESFVTCTHEAMLHISAFMLADANTFASKDDLNRYITQKLQYSDSHFEMTTRQKYIIIKKFGQLRDETYDSDDSEKLFAEN